MQFRSTLRPALLAAMCLAACATNPRKNMTKQELEAEMNAKWGEFMTPGAAHKTLDKKVGRWTTKVRVYMPDGTAQEWTGTSESKWIMDGRYLHDTFEGTAMGTQFHGMGTTGYDNIKHKYVGTWIDSMGTGITMSEGTFDPATKTFTYTSEMPNVLDWKYDTARVIEKWTDDDHWTMQVFGPDPNGEEMLSMEIHYTRAR